MKKYKHTNDQLAEAKFKTELNHVKEPKIVDEGEEQ